ncbi:MAG: UbiD family decarboxylase [Candidatus Micrarchaeota archaeon]
MKFRDFINKLDSEKKIIHITKEVSTNKEAAAYLKKYDGTPLIFENVKTERGKGMRIVGNLLSSVELIEEGMQISKGQFISKMIEALDKPASFEKVSNADFEYFEPDLSLIPILHHYPLDQGPYITSAVVFAHRNGIRNMSYHRLTPIGKDRLVGRLVEKRDLHTLYEDAKAHGEDVDVAITIGNSVGVLIAGATSIEQGKYELGIASALENGLKVVGAKTNSAEYPVDSEIVLEGKILHDETAKEGPFVDLTATYDIVREQPVFAIDKIAMKKEPIYQALLPAGNEHKLLMGLPRTPTIYKAVKEAGIDVVGVYLTPGGSGWLDAVISIRKKSDDEPKKAIEAAIKGHRSLKRITIVDDDVDITNPDEVSYAVTMYWRAGKEYVFNNVKGSSLDPMATPDGMGSKLAIDATKPLDVPKEKLLKMKKANMDIKL